MPPTVVNRTLVDATPEAVFDYLTDLRRELEWNEKLLEVEPLTGDPVRPGSRFRVRFAGPVGEAVITYLEVERPTRWRTTSASARLDVDFTGSVAGTAGASEVTLRTTLRPRGFLRLLGPLVRRAMHASWEHHLAVLKRSLEAAGSTN